MTCSRCQSTIPDRALYCPFCGAGGESLGRDVAFRYTPPDPADPRGPDGHGRNRLGINTMSPTPRCLLLPTSYQAAWESQHRPHPRFEPSWHLYEKCRGTDCATCPVATKRAPVRPFGPSVIRVDESGHPWAMNRQHKGWGEFGYRYETWGDLLASLAIVLGPRGRDKDGEFFAFEPEDC